jgi:hypothetical protein
MKRFFFKQKNFTVESRYFDLTLKITQTQMKWFFNLSFQIKEKNS